MATQSDYVFGTITLTNGQADFTGTGTAWQAAEFGDGDTIIDLPGATEYTGIIAAITGQGSGTLTLPWEGPDLTNVTYRMRFQANGSRYPAKVAQLIEQISALDVNTQGIFYNFSTGVAGDPGPGFIRINNAVLASATAIYFDILDANTVQRNVAGLLGLWSAGTTLIIRSIETTSYVAYRLTTALTNNTGYFTAPSIQFIGSSGALSANEAVSIAWFGVGEGLEISAIGTFAQRATYNTQPAGFTYLSIDGNGTTGVATIYRKNSATSGDWSGGAVMQGPSGFTGWSPRFSIVFDGERRVMRLLGYVGGTGTAPTTGVGQYVGPTGYVAAIADGVDMRGSVGQTAYQLAVSLGFVGDEAAWIASLAAPSNYDLAVQEGYAGSIDDWLLSLIGPAGADGTDPGVLMVFDTGTSDANPGPGLLRSDNADLTVATFLYVSKINRAGNDIGTFLATLNLSDSIRKGTLVITRSGGDAQVTYDVMGFTDAVGYVKVAVANGDGTPSFDLNDTISFQFSAAGDRGTNGDGAGDFVGPDVAVQDNIMTFDGTSGKLGKDSGIPIGNVILSGNNGSDFNNRHSTYDNLHLKAADLASAATLNLDTTNGWFVTVTGTVATTAITLTSGRERLVRAAAAWPLTHGTNLQLPGGANYVCSVGDLIMFAADGAVVRAMIYPISGKAVVASGGDVVGPAASVNNRIAAFDGITGKLLKDGGMLVASISTGLTIVKVFTANGTWSATNATTIKGIRVRVQGAGGGGGGTAPDGAGGGGGGGGFGEKTLFPAPSGSTAVTVGANGTAGTATPTAGGNGGNSSFGTTVVASGGTGGQSSAGASGPYPGGGATGGDLNIIGQSGSNRSLTFIVANPPGGSSTSGFSDGIVVSNGNYNSGVLSAPGYGVGGMGPKATAAAGPFSAQSGGPGIVIVEEFY